MSEKLVNFRYEDEKYQKLKEIAVKERLDIKDLIGSLIDDYIKIHGDGNPTYKITDYVDENFMCCPAFYRDGLAWEQYIKNADNEEKQKIKSQIILLDKKLSMYI